MKRRAHHAPANMTQQHNRVMAFAKVRTGDLSRMTPETLDSIAATAVKRGTPAFDKLRAELQATLDHRRAQERAA